MKNKLSWAAAAIARPRSTLDDGAAAPARGTICRAFCRLGASGCDAAPA
jgi:hypothetical protein